MNGFDALIPSMFNHLWQTTLFVAVVALGAYMMRGNRASVRHVMWLAASVKFLVPLSALAALEELFQPEVVVPALQPGRNFFELTAVFVEPMAATEPAANWTAWLALV